MDDFEKDIKEIAFSPDETLEQRVDKVEQRLSDLLDAKDASGEEIGIRKRASDSNVKINEIDLRLKVISIVAALTYMIFIAFIFTLLLFCPTSYLQAEKSDPHVALALIIGCFTSMISAVALMLKSFSKVNSSDSLEKSLTPEIIKTIIDAAKPGAK